MGLFDIFRRRAKKHQKESAVQSAALQSEQSLSESLINSQSEIPSPGRSSEAPSQQPSQSTVSLSLTAGSEQEIKSDSQVSVDASSQSVQTAVQTSVEQSVSPNVNDVVASSSKNAASSNSETINQSEVTTPAAEPEEKPADQQEKEDKYEHGLAKSRHGFGARLNAFLANFRHVDEDFFDDLEDLMIESDVGYEMTMKLSDELREEVKLQNAKSKQDVTNVIIEKMVDLYEAAGKGENPNINFASQGPTVIMFVGVNGAGKTTTIGKMAAMYKRQGKKVLLAAADTFRAGAVEQLDVWAKRDGVDIVTGPENGDPAAVVYDAVTKAKAEDYDILFVDTAGRLQNKVNLMKELAKMKRVLTREIPEAPHEVLLVLDATTGQNALTQAKDFQDATDVTGIVLTKLDGTARGGIVLAIRNELHLPVKYVGLGEQVDDLQKFDANEFVYGLFKGLVTTGK